MDKHHFSKDIESSNIFRKLWFYEKSQSIIKLYDGLEILIQIIEKDMLREYISIPYLEMILVVSKIMISMLHWIMGILY